MAIKLKKEEEIKKVINSNTDENNSNSSLNEKDNDSSKQQEIKTVETDQNRKLSKKEKKELNKKNKIKKSKLEVFTIIFVIGVIISAVVLGLFLAAPVVCFILGLFTLFGLVAYVLGATCITLGLIWISEKARIIVGKITNVMNTFFNAGSKAAELVKPAFVYISSIAGVFLLLSLIFSIVGYKINKGKEDNPFKKHMIVSIIFSSLVVIFIIVNLVVYFVNKK